MSRSHKVTGFLLVVMLGAYGCSKGPAGPGERGSGAESRLQRLEEDYKAAAAARDSFRQRLIAAEEKQAHLQRQLEQATSTASQERNERDAARAELLARTAERDQLQVQYESFRKNLKELLGEAEAALNPPIAPPPVLVGTQTTSPGPEVRN